MEELVRGAEKMLGEIRIACDKAFQLANKPSPTASDVKPREGSILRPRIRLRETVEDVKWAEENPEIQEILDMINDAVDHL